MESDEIVTIISMGIIIGLGFGFLPILIGSFIQGFFDLIRGKN